MAGQLWAGRNGDALPCKCAWPKRDRGRTPLARLSASIVVCICPLRCFFFATFLPICVLSNASNSASIKLNHDHFRCCWFIMAFGALPFPFPAPWCFNSRVIASFNMQPPLGLLSSVARRPLFAVHTPSFDSDIHYQNTPLLTLSVRNKRRVSFRGLSYIQGVRPSFGNKNCTS